MKDYLNENMTFYKQTIQTFIMSLKLSTASLRARENTSEDNLKTEKES